MAVVDCNSIVFAKNNRLKTSVYKLNLVADLIRGASVQDALIQLSFCRKRVSKDVKKVLESAIANAENNNGFDIDKLYIKSVDIGKSVTLKRMRARARGRGMRVLKHFSFLRVVVGL